MPIYVCEQCKRKFRRMGNKKAYRKFRFCSRKCMGIYFKEHVSNPMMMLNRILFHPQKLTSTANIIEPDGPEIGWIINTREMLTSVNFAYYSSQTSRTQYPQLPSLQEWHNQKVNQRLTTGEQKRFLNMFTPDWKLAPVTTLAERNINIKFKLKVESQFTHLHVEAGVTIGVNTAIEDLPRGDCYVFFDRKVSAMELSKGERIQLAALLLQGIPDQTQPKIGKFNSPIPKLNLGKA